MAENVCVSSPTRVLVLGHSFVARLQSFLQYCEYQSQCSSFGDTSPELKATLDRIHAWKIDANLGLNSYEYAISMHGIGGMKMRAEKQVKSLTSQLTAEVITDAMPDIVFVEIGSNDLCSPGKCPRLLARNVVSFARYLREMYLVKLVILGSVLPRRDLGIPFPRYNDNVHAFNNEVTALVKETAGVSQWKHRGFTRTLKKEFFDPDGIHLAFEGNGALACSIKRAIISAHFRQ